MISDKNYYFCMYWNDFVVNILEKIEGNKVFLREEMKIHTN